MTPLRSRLLAVIGATVALATVEIAEGAGRLNDFTAWITGARLLRTSSLYAIASQQAVGAVVAGKPSDVVFISPPLVAMIFTPLANLNPHVSMAIFVALSLLGLAIAGWLIAARWLPGLTTFQRVVLVLAVVACEPAAYGIAIGQLDPLLFVAVVAGITVARRYPILGGMLIGSVALKPQLLVLVPVALIVGRHWRVLAGVAISVALTGLSVLAMGVSHLLDWPRFVAVYGNLHSNGSISVPEAVARLTGIGSLSTLVAAVLLVAGAVWLGRHRDRLSSVPAALGYGLLFTVLGSPHLFPYDAVFLCIPLLWLARSDWSTALTLTLLVSAAAYVDAFLGNGVVQPVLLLGIAAVLVQPRPGAIAVSLRAGGRRAGAVALAAIPVHW